MKEEMPGEDLKQPAEEQNSADKPKAGSDAWEALRKNVQAAGKASGADEKPRKRPEEKIPENNTDVTEKRTPEKRPAKNTPGETGEKKPHQRRTRNTAGRAAGNARRAPEDGTKRSRPAGASAGKSARPDTRQSAGASPEARRIAARKRARRARAKKKRMIMIGAAAIVVLLAAVLIAVFVRSCSSRKNNTESTSINGEGTSGQTGFAVTGGDETAEAEPLPTPEPTPDPYADKPDIDINSWEYILANATHSIEDYAPETDYFEDVLLDYRIIEPMSAFVDGARNQGLNVVMTSGYRSYYDQTALFENKVAEYGDEAVAATIVAPPGTSEHQTGLAADITDDYYEYMNESLEETELYKWMSAHCQEYGFIVRFPKGKDAVTGIIYEPWHFRYVGVEAATYIMEHDLTLEEFIDLYKA